MNLVSIIVPCYNQAQYLDECLQSVLDQTYQNWECIIVNDGSLDDTGEIVKKWLKKDNRFQYFYKKNEGVSLARNYGIDKSNGIYIQLLDGDDILQKNKISHQVKRFESNSKIDIIYGGNRYFIDGDKNNLYAIHPKGIIPSIELQYTDKNQLDVLLIKNISTICAPLYKRVIFEKVMFRDTVYEDYLFHIECSFNGFIFHFEIAEGTYCLVRLTNNSQMIRHINDKERNIVFIEELNRIKSIYHSKF